MTPGIDQLVNYGVLGIIVAFVLYAVWKVGSKGGTKVIELGERYVTSTEKLHDTLKESDNRQKELCAAHAESLLALSESMEQQNQIAQVSCDHLEALVASHGPDWVGTMRVIHQNNKELQRVKQAARRACEMCRHLTQAEFPNSAEQVAKHCDEIERIIGEA